MTNFLTSAQREPIIVYPIRKGGSSWDDNELRHSLRSVAEHWISETPPKVFVLTEATLPFLNPETVTVVKLGPYGKCIRKACELAKTHSPTRDYVWMNDDIFFLQDTSAADLVPVRYQGVMRPYGGEEPSNGWRRKLYRVRDQLADQGIEQIYNYSTHLPYLFSAELMERTIALFGLNYKLPLELAYYNYWSHLFPKPRRVKDRLMRHHDKDFGYDLSGKRFLNIAAKSTTPRMQYFIRGLYPNKCEYER